MRRQQRTGSSRVQLAARARQGRCRCSLHERATRAKGVESRRAHRRCAPTPPPGAHLPPAAGRRLPLPPAHPAPPSPAPAGRPAPPGSWPAPPAAPPPRPSHAPGLERGTRVQGGAAVEGRLGGGWVRGAAAAAAAAISRSLTSAARCSSSACCCSSPRMVAAMQVEGVGGARACAVAARGSGEQRGCAPARVAVHQRSDMCWSAAPQLIQTPCPQARTLELAQAREVAVAQRLGAGDRPLRPLPELGLEAVQLALERRQVDAGGHGWAGGAREGGEAGARLPRAGAGLRWGRGVAGQGAQGCCRSSRLQFGGQASLASIQAWACRECAASHAPLPAPRPATHPQNRPATRERAWVPRA